MQIAIYIIVGFVAFLHLYILYFEMFAWSTKGPKIFDSIPNELFVPTKAMAANQGLYNGFLSAGLIWSFFIENVEWQQNVAIFFLACVAIAGIYGAMSISRKIFFVQTVPAFIGIALLCVQIFS